MMKTTRILSMAMATLTLAAMPLTATMAEEAQDTVKTGIMTVNGKPATPAQKAVAKQMTKQGAQMGRKAAQLAVAAVTNPKKAEKMADELEAMGDEMERLGDSLETLAEDTTFFYEGEDSDAMVVSDEDWEDFAQDIRSIKEELGLNTWWGKLIGGGLGLFGGLFGILIAILVMVLLFLLFMSPIWVVALIVWLIVRGTRTNKTTAYVNPPLNAAAASTAQSAGTEQAAMAAQPVGQTLDTQPYPDENAEMWKSGIMWSCIGVGLILVFLGIGLDGLWGIGGLVACIGVAKLVIATTTKKKRNADATPYGDERLRGQADNYGTADCVPRSDDYNKSEN